MLKKQIKKTIVDYLENVDLLQNKIGSYKNLQPIKPFYDNGNITDSEIDSALEQAIFKQAKKDYKTLLNKLNPDKGQYIPITIMEEYIAFAIVKEEKFLRKRHSFKELIKIDGTYKNIDNFIESKYQENLPSTIRKEILEQKRFGEPFQRNK